MYKHILLPTDGSELSKRAIAHGIELAKSARAKITTLVVSTPLQSLVVDARALEKSLEPYRQFVTQQSARYLDTVRDAATAAGVHCDVMQVENDQPYAAIIKAAEDNGCDLIIMASHGLSGTSAIVLGSETLKVLTHTSVPVLVYR